jgi:hypothetical protein
MFVLCTHWVHSRVSVTCARLCRVSLWTDILVCLLISVRAGSAMCPNFFHVLVQVTSTMLSFGTLLIFNNFFGVYYMSFLFRLTTKAVRGVFAPCYFMRVPEKS